MLPKNTEDIVYKAVESGELTIDTQGRVWRLSVRRGNRWTGGSASIPCKPRRAEKLTGEYLQVRVMVNYKRANALAQRLVWRHFFGQIPEGLTINHKNGIKTDNHPDNLELATYSEQVIHAVHVLRTGRTANQWGMANHAAKLTDSQVKEIRRRREAGEPLKSIAADYCVAMQTISRIVRLERRVGSRGA
jgi:hypothetical protein